MKLATGHRMVRDIAVISTDLAGNVTVFNAVAEKLLGYPAQEIIGKAIPIDGFSDFRDNPTAYFNRPIETQFRLANGNTIQLEALLSPIQNAHGEENGILLTAQPISHLKEDFNLQNLPDERILDIVLKREINRLQREKQSLSLIKIDVDHYTAYREKFGDVKTNELLLEIGFALQERVQRASDLLAYCGFDEFWVLLPNTDLPGVVKVAEQLRLKIMSLAWPAATDDHDGNITVSLGIAHLIPARDTTVSTVRCLADSALQEAKDQGRNCTRYQIVQPENG